MLLKGIKNNNRMLNIYIYCLMLKIAMGKNETTQREQEY